MMILQYSDTAEFKSSKIKGGTRELTEQSVVAGLQKLVSQEFIKVQPLTSNYTKKLNEIARDQTLTATNFYTEVAKAYIANRNNGQEPASALETALNDFKDKNNTSFLTLELNKTQVVGANPFAVWKSAEERGGTDLTKAIRENLA